MANSGNTSKPFNAKAWIDDLKAHAEAGTVPPTVSSPKSSSIFSHFQSNPATVADASVPIGKRVAQNWRALEGGQKVNVAVWGAGALLSAFGAASAARNASYRDDDNKLHTQWSNVGIALLQATLTAGCAYAGMHALHSAAR